jgi:hypothetical protein
MALLEALPVEVLTTTQSGRLVIAALDVSRLLDVGDAGRAVRYISPPS